MNDMNLNSILSRADIVTTSQVCDRMSFSLEHLIDKFFKIRDSIVNDSLCILAKAPFIRQL